MLRCIYTRIHYISTVNLVMLRVKAISNISEQRQCFLIYIIYVPRINACFPAIVPKPFYERCYEKWALLSLH
jgi:hypothetical protein